MKGYLKYKIRETIFKKIFLFYDLALKIKDVILSVSLYAFTLSSLLFFCLFLFDLGFKKDLSDVSVVNKGYVLILSILFISKFIIELFQISLKKWYLLIIKSVLLILVFIILSLQYKHPEIPSDLISSIFHTKYALIIGSIILILTETYRLSNFADKINLSPGLLFASSFIIIILIGSGLLMMPNATIRSISYLEALFTATSAVCVTGLVVVDTATAFTSVGKGIILFLIQIGGLGVMAFTGFFSYIFSGTASLKERFVLKDIFSGEQLSGMFRLLTKILLITLIVEGIGAILIYYSLDGFRDQKVVYAVFHAISAFCNAGFSIFNDGMANTSLHSNYFLQITICIVIILGGVGFPVLLHFFNIIKQYWKNILYKLTGSKRDLKVYPLLLSQNIAVKTSIVLLLLGTIMYYLFEKNGSLSNFDTTGKLITSFFGSTSARTAGFNIVDIASWSYPTLFFMIVLMWIGASPGSTGGGIKTTTFTLALRTAINYVRGREHLEIGNREIGMPTIIRVLSIIIASIIIIFISFILLLYFDPLKNPVHLLFECVSAFSTVGLSIADTAMLSINSKIVIILLMFIGRIGPVVLLSGLLLSKKEKHYKLPVENLAIN